MLSMDDTIAAVSSASLPAGTAGRIIIRISGPQTWPIVEQILTPDKPFQKNRIADCRVHIGEGLDIRGLLYAFFQPHSYTGQDLAELHLDVCSAAADAILKKIYCSARPAMPGEFTQRAYLNGRLDLTQAEAVAEIVAAANTAQLEAAERLLSGRFSETLSDLRNEMLELLGLLEAELDFAEEEIEFISKDRACEQISRFQQRISNLLEGSIRCERIIDMDAVGLAGLPNAGKSRLLNALLETERSIVSDAAATTRDVLTGILRLDGLDCILFDCAGLMPISEQTALVDRMAHQASLTALNKAALVLFCVDGSKEDIETDVQMRKQIQMPAVIYVMTKSDILRPQDAAQRCKQLQQVFGGEFLPTSAAAESGLDALKQRIRMELLRLRAGDREHQDRLTINQRHEQKLQETLKLLAAADDEIRRDSIETGSMLLRQSCQLLSGLEHEDISEQILDRIFSRFCIGK